MADNEISVSLTAKVDQLQAGLDQSRDAMGRFVAGAKSDLDQLVQHSEESKELLKQILNGEAFIVMKEKAEVAFEAIKEGFELLKEGFESTIVKAEEFGLSNAKFAAMMGTSETEAAGFSAALRGVGSSAQEFESMALRMEMRLNANEGAMKQLGITTRDQSGNLLGGKDLMESAIATMQTYKAGTDQNAFALQVFGRRAADVYDLMRVSNEDVEHQVDLYDKMGVTLEGTGGDSQKLEGALNDLHTIVDALGIKIGQELMPYAQAALEWMGKEGVTFANNLAKAIVDLAESTLSFVKVAAQAVSLFETVHGAIHTMITAGDEAPRTAAFDDLAASLDHLSKSFKTLTAAKAEASKPFHIGDNQTDENGVPKSLQAPAKNPYDFSGGDRKFVTPTNGKGGPDKTESEDISSDEKIALAKIAIAEETDKHLEAMGQETSATLLAQERDAEDQKFLVKSNAIHAEMALKGQSKVQEEKLLDDLLLLNVTHQGELLKLDQEAESQKAALAKTALANALKDDDEMLKEQRANLTEAVAQGKITAVEKDNLEIAFTQTVRQEELARLDARLATLPKDSKEYEDVVNQKRTVEKKFTADMKAENAQRTKDIETSVKQWLTPMVSGFNTGINDMILHGKSLQQAMQATWDSILSGGLSMLEQLAEKWLVTSITNEIVSTTTTGTMARTDIAAEAAVAAASAYAATVGLPGGILLAPAAAGEAYAAVMTWQASVPAAAGGMLLDRDQLVYAHKDEQILPAHLSMGLQNIINNGGASSASHTTHLDYHPSFNQPNVDVIAELRRQPAALAAIITQAQRDGMFRGR